MEICYIKLSIAQEQQQFCLPYVCFHLRTTSVPEEVGHALSAAKKFSLNFTVPGYYTYWYGAIQSDSHYIDYCLGRERTC